MTVWKPLLAGIAKAALQGYLNGLEKKTAAERGSPPEFEPPSKAPSNIPRFKSAGAVSNSWDNNPDLPSHLRRLPGETNDEQTERIAAYLDARRPIATSKTSSSQDFGHIYDEHLFNNNETERECGACDGRGSYYGKRGHTRCGNCFGTGKMRRRIIGR